MERSFLEAVKNRRSIYGISKEKLVSEEKIQEIVKELMLHTPSAFNSQSARVVLLFDAQHAKLWDMTTDVLKKIVPEEAFAQTQEKLEGFKSGYGTLLFFEDQSVVEGLQEAFSLYKDNFPVWSLQSSGMLQYAIWTQLSDLGLGASLQHYNPLIDEEVKKEWSIPDKWKLLAQMPFGKAVEHAGDKAFLPIEERIKVF